MSTVSGIFKSRADAEQTMKKLSSIGLDKDRVVMLTPDETKDNERDIIPTSDMEQPGMGTAVGSVVGGAAGIAGGMSLGAMTAAAIPGVGPVIAMGLLGGAVLGLAGARVGGILEDSMAKGLPADEIFIYEDALRRGRSVLLAFPDETAAEAVRGMLAAAGAETIDAARKQWWVGLRDAEKEHYQVAGRTFDQDEDFYRMGFETALDSRNRGKKCEQVLKEKAGELKAISENKPDARMAFRRGYEHGQNYYRSCCSKAA